MTRHTRRAVLGAVGAGMAALAGCSTGSSGPGPGPAGTGGAAGPSGTTGSPGSSERDTATPAASTVDLPLADERHPMQHTAETFRDGVQSGGQPRDGIPSVDDPRFWDADRADDRLDGDEVVFGVVGDREVKAYPQRVLVWHEICNDTLDGRPVSVTYCPLTGTALGFLRGETEFGVSGNLVNSNLVMYDRATDSRWPQVLATAIEGPFLGRSLRQFPVVWTTWARWRDAHPDTLVLSEDTGFARNYGSDPYGSYAPRGGYYASGRPIFATLARDDHFGHKDVVVGTRAAGTHAFHRATVRERGLLAGGDLLAVHDPALDTVRVYRNPDGVEFEYVRDDDGARVVDPGGEHAPGDLPLERVLAFDAMWFAWYAFYPGTEVHGG